MLCKFLSIYMCMFFNIRTQLKNKGIEKKFKEQPVNSNNKVINRNISNSWMKLKILLKLILIKYISPCFVIKCVYFHYISKISHFNCFMLWHAWSEHCGTLFFTLLHFVFFRMTNDLLHLCSSSLRVFIICET